MNKYYVYAHCRIGDPKDKPFYIGKGCGRRAEEKTSRSRYWKNIVNKNGYYSYFIKDSLSEEDSYALEIEMIYKYKCMGCCESNMTLGGDGVRVIKRWWYNQDWKDKISAALRKNNHKGRDSNSFKDVISKEELYDLYVNKKMSSVQICNVTNISYTTIITRLREYGIEVRDCGRKKTKIICTNDGNIFESISSAARFYNIYRENISKVLKGKYKSTNNLKFKQHESVT
jgi:hypothetical protein